MDAEPLPFIEQDWWLEEHRASWRVITNSLLGPGDASAKTAQITNELDILGKEPEDGFFLESLWWILIDIVGAIPPDHPWQDILVHVVENLSHLDGPHSQDGVSCPFHSPQPDAC
jgi:hypothetical protein